MIYAFFLFVFVQKSFLTKNYWSKMYFLLLNYENDNTCRSPSLWRRLDSGSRWFDYNLIRIDVGSFISCSYDNNNSITQRCFWLGRQLNWCVHRNLIDGLLFVTHYEVRRLPLYLHDIKISPIRGENPLASGQG